MFKFSIFKVKKWMAFGLAGFIPVICFIITLISTFDLNLSMMVAIVGVILSVILGGLLIRHALIDMLEGKGLMAWTVDSTGVIDSFIVGVNPPYVQGRFGKNEVSTAFDRDMVCQWMVPKKGELIEALEVDDQGNVCGKCTCLKLPPAEERHKFAFKLESFLCFIYNKNLGVFLSKDVLSKNEKETMIKHVILYLLRKTEELSQRIRDFARYIVEQTRPRKSIFKNRSFIIIIVIILIILIIAMFIGPVLTTIQSSGGDLIPIP